MLGENDYYWIEDEEWGYCFYYREECDETFRLKLMLLSNANLHHYNKETDEWDLVYGIEGIPANKVG